MVVFRVAFDESSLYTTWVQAIEYKCLRFSSLPPSVAISVAAQRPLAILTTCCGLPEAILDWLQSGVVHPGKPNIRGVGLSL